MELMSYDDCQAKAASDSIAGYNILVDFYFSIGGHNFVLHHDIIGAMNAMASWYLTNIIGQRLSEFERFKL